MKNISKKKPFITKENERDVDKYHKCDKLLNPKDASVKTSLSCDKAY